MYGDKGEVPEEEYLLPLGKAHLVRAGGDVTIVGFGKIFKEAIKAADELAKEGIQADLIDLRSVRPIDYPAVVESIKKTNRMVIIEEAWPLGNISTEIIAHVQEHAFDYLDAPIRRLNTADTPMAYSPVLVEAFLPNAQQVIQAAKDVLYL
jgi:Pyruvate/2-oxoglutarate dehydrogenase complex, dehydrogenase (E1) component, eukaryotic type, beta subunit